MEIIRTVLIIIGVITVARWSLAAVEEILREGGLIDRFIWRKTVEEKKPKK